MFLPSEEEMTRVVQDNADIQDNAEDIIHDI